MGTSNFRNHENGIYLIPEYTEEEFKTAVEAEIKKYNPDYFTVICIDRSFT